MSVKQTKRNTKMKKMRRGGLSYDDIATFFKLNKKTVWSIINNYPEMKKKKRGE